MGPRLKSLLLCALRCTDGEDPYHIQTIGVTALQGLQNPQPVPRGAAGDVFFATRQVTRHYIAYHGARPDIPGGANATGQEFVASNRTLHDSYFPTYATNRAAQ